MPTLGAFSMRLHMFWILAFIPLLLFPAYGLNNDTAALLRFLKGVRYDPSGKIQSTWLENTLDSSGCPLGWYGVSCEGGRVTGLELEGLNLSGEIVQGSLGALSQLSFLRLYSNYFFGSLPEDLGNLSALQELDLSKNLFNGSIPSTLSNLHILINLTLAGNEFGGTIPDMFQNWASLVLVDLSNNSLNDVIPQTLTLLPHLSALNLSWNQLSGGLPQNMGQLQQLRILDLSHNRLSGSVDPAFLSLNKLLYVDLSSNDFWGPLPWQQMMPTVFHIVHVNLSHNRFSGPLASGNAANLFANQLQILDVSSNQLSGDLPLFEFIFALKVLKLQTNSFSGGVPPALITSDSSILEDIDISMNNLSGKLDSITAKNLHSLKLSSNMLSGDLPTKFGSCATIDLSSNQFSGNLSGMNSWSDNLEIVNLSHNSLMGELPNQTAQLLQLMFLNLSQNSLSGSIPYSFGSYLKLTVLDLTANQLTGIVPRSFFHSHSLTDLRLAHNLLYGNIVLGSASNSDSAPIQRITALTNLTPLVSFIYSPLVVLDLSWNNLNGPIPQEIGSLTTLEAVDLSKNELVGAITSQFSQLANLRSLDLSFNQLTGELPSGLPLSLQALNVSNNHFSGHIPPSLQKEFPLASFFPGNSDLSLSGGPGSSPPEAVILTKGKRKINGVALKAGLIGGCTAIALLMCVFAVFMYRKEFSSSHKKERMQEFHGINKEFDQPPANTDIPRRPDYDNSIDAVATPAESVSFSREQLLSPEAGTCSDTKGTVNPKNTVQAGSSSPSQKHFTLMREHKTILKVRSPDKLAGDLILIDDSFGFTAEDLSRAPAEVLGRSSHGTSYKATLDNGNVLVVKWLREGLVENKRDFMKQAKTYGNIRHPNVMPVIGYYWGPREHEKLVVSDFVISGSLAGRISERAGRKISPLSWLQRLRIAVDTARGLSYLHSEHRLPHGNLKATNILLEGPDLDARISDYGYHKLMTRYGISSQIKNAGDLGYQAPELANAKTPKPSLKADVYAFGVILLELVTGKGAGDIIPESSGTVDLPDWVRLQVKEGFSSTCFDPTFENGEEDKSPSKGLQEVLEIALKCLSSPSRRPSMKNIFEELAAIKLE